MKDVHLKLGTRGSPLALIQAEETRQRLLVAWPQLDLAQIELVVVKTTGDQVRDRALAEIGGKGLFTKEIDEALLSGRIDVAVHSLKDVPTWLPEGMEIAAVLEREDPRDALIAGPVTAIADLPQGARLGTASLRRQAQALARRPDLQPGLLRGNVETRLAKVAGKEVDATFLAMAGLKRLGRLDAVSAALSLEEMIPAVGQGAIGLATRGDDTQSQDLLAAINHGDSHAAVTCERACLDVLDGSCHTPIGVHAQTQGRDLLVRACLLTPDGRYQKAASQKGPASRALALGHDLGRQLRAAVDPQVLKQLGLG